MIKRWDPMWGWDDEVYYLGTEDISSVFFMATAKLYKFPNELVPEHAPARLCAGTFDNNYYFGSCTYDTPDSKDQEIYVANKDWKILTSLRPSSILSSPCQWFGKKQIDNRCVYAFRDPCRMPTGEIAVVTGGDRWNTFGNICAVRYSVEYNSLDISRGTILDKSLCIFNEIERPCFFEDWMFFSIDGGASTKACSTIHVAKLGKGHIYHLYGEVENSNKCYGMNIKKGKYATYWRRDLFDIVIPKKPNLVYKNKRWSIY